LAGCAVHYRMGKEFLIARMSRYGEHAHAWAGNRNERAHRDPTRSSSAKRNASELRLLCAAAAHDDAKLVRLRL